MFKFNFLDNEDDSSCNPPKVLSSFNTIHIYVSKKASKKEAAPHFLLCFTVTHTHSPPSSSRFPELHYSRLSMILLRAVGAH